MADPVLKLGDSGPSVTEAQDLLNRNGAILDADGAFGKGTDAAVREFQAGAVPSLPVTGVIDSVTWQVLRALPEPLPDLPVRAVAFIGREEVGSRELYDRMVCRPAWPGGPSGVTIGVGYDLGQQNPPSTTTGPAFCRPPTWRRCGPGSRCGVRPRQADPPLSRTSPSRGPLPGRYSSAAPFPIRFAPRAPLLTGGRPCRPSVSESW